MKVLCVRSGKVGMVITNTNHHTGRTVLSVIWDCGYNERLYSTRGLQFDGDIHALLKQQGPREDFQKGPSRERKNQWTERN